MDKIQLNSYISMEQRMQFLHGLFFIGFLIVAIFLSTLYFTQNTDFKQNFSLPTFLNGKSATAFDDNFSRYFPIEKFARSFWGKTEYNFFNQGRDGVVIGNEGWLFTSEEFSTPQNRQQLFQTNKNFILDVHQLFQGKSINLVIALIPVKYRVYDDYLSNSVYPHHNDKLHRNILKFFEENDIEYINLLSVLKNNENTYLKQDTHWSPIGAKISAKEVARYIHQNQIFKNDTKSYQLSKNGYKNTIEPDLMRYLPLGDDKIFSKTIEINRAQAIKDQEADETSLFSDINIPIALVGTSYSANPNWGFHDFLQYYLQADILNAADEGLGPFDVMKKYLDDDSVKNNPPEIIIWEIPERYLVIEPEKNQSL